MHQYPGLNPCKKNKWNRVWDNKLSNQEIRLQNCPGAQTLWRRSVAHQGWKAARIAYRPSRGKQVRNLKTSTFLNEQMNSSKMFKKGSGGPCPTNQDLAYILGINQMFMLPRCIRWCVWFSTLKFCPGFKDLSCTSPQGHLLVGNQSILRFSFGNMAYIVWYEDVG